MASIVDIKDQIKSIKNIEQITKAVELISISKMRQANQKYLSNRKYVAMIKQVIKDILANDDDIYHPYLSPREIKNRAYVVIASDTGMAGEYNSRVLSYALEKIKNEPSDHDVYTIGNMAWEYFVKNGITPEQKFLNYAQNPTLGHARSITATLVHQYDEKLIDEIYIIYTSHREGRLNVVEEMRLLPILKEDFDDQNLHHVAQLDFEPSAEEVFNILVPQYILGLIYSCMIESVKCEHEERMDAMYTASNNAFELLNELETKYHRARQEQITMELAEISYSALNKGSEIND